MRARAIKHVAHRTYLLHRLHLINRGMKDKEELEDKTGTPEDIEPREAQRALTLLQSLTREVGLFRSMLWDKERDEEFGTA